MAEVAASCDRGDFAEYASLRRQLSELEGDQVIQFHGSQRLALQPVRGHLGALDWLGDADWRATEVHLIRSHLAARPRYEVVGSWPLRPRAGDGGEVVAEQDVAVRADVVLAVGLPGSGKSSWFKRHNITPLSSDMLRSLLFDDPAEQRFQDLVFSNLRSMLKARLIAHRPLNYVDATNLTPQERQNWIKLAKDFGYEVQAVFFDVPLEVCIERHQRRDRLVPEDVMRKMSAKLKAPTFDEGFSKITVVRVKQQKPE